MEANEPAKMVVKNAGILFATDASLQQRVREEEDTCDLRFIFQGYMNCKANALLLSIH